MGLESGTYISDLIATNPAGTDQRYTMDDHIRLIKAVLKNTFPNLNGPVQMTPDLLNSVKVSPVSITGNYNVTAADHGKVIYANANAGAITVTFASAAALGAGFHVTVIKTDSSANTITLDPSGTETVNGSSTLTLSAPMEMAEIHYNSDTALQVGKPPTIIPTGTKMVFAQAAAPTGWTQDASVNDRVLRVVSGAGAGVGGSWAISGLSHAHSHGMAHTHESPVRVLDLVAGQGADNADIWQAGGNSPAFGLGEFRAGIVASGIDTSQSNLTTQTALTSGPSTDNTGGASPAEVSSDGKWRPAYLDVIVASKN